MKFISQSRRISVPRSGGWGEDSESNYEDITILDPDLAQAVDDISLQLKSRQSPSWSRRNRSRADNELFPLCALTFRFLFGFGPCRVLTGSPGSSFDSARDQFHASPFVCGSLSVSNRFIQISTVDDDGDDDNNNNQRWDSPHARRNAFCCSISCLKLNVGVFP